MQEKTDKPGQGDVGKKWPEGETGKQGGDIGKKGGSGELPKEEEKELPEKELPEKKL